MECEEWQSPICISLRAWASDTSVGEIILWKCWTEWTGQARSPDWRRCRWPHFWQLFGMSCQCPHSEWARAIARPQREPYSFVVLCRGSISAKSLGRALTRLVQCFRYQIECWLQRERLQLIRYCIMQRAYWTAQNVALTVAFEANYASARWVRCIGGCFKGGRPVGDVVEHNVDAGTTRHIAIVRDKTFMLNRIQVEQTDGVFTLGRGISRVDGT